MQNSLQNLTGSHQTRKPGKFSLSTQLNHHHRAECGWEWGSSTTHCTVLYQEKTFSLLLIVSSLNKNYLIWFLVTDIPEGWRRQWHPTPVLLPGKIPWMEEPGRLQSMGSRRVRHWATSLSLSCIGEGNGNPLQWSCLENPRDGGAWWAAVYGVAQSRTRLKQLSSSSSIMNLCYLLCLGWASKLTLKN